MNRRGFFTSLAALASTAVVPAVLLIPVSPTFVYKLLTNSLYGKFNDSLVVYDIETRPRHPESLSQRS